MNSEDHFNNFMVAVWIVVIMIVFVYIIGSYDDSRYRYEPLPCDDYYECYYIEPDYRFNG